MNKKTEKILVELITALIVAILTVALVIFAVWLVCVGFDIAFKVKYAYPVFAFVMLNNSFPIKLYHRYKKKNDKTS